jgi:flagellar hook-basal body complex protein FliE
MKASIIDNDTQAIITAKGANNQTGAAEPASFGEFLNDSINKVSRLQNEANQSIEALASGQNKDIHNTMIAMEKAGVAFRFMMEIRNKVISAYETIMRMQV